MSGVGGGRRPQWRTARTRLDGGQKVGMPGHDGSGSLKTEAARHSETIKFVMTRRIKDIYVIALDGHPGKSYKFNYKTGMAIKKSKATEWGHTFKPSIFRWILFECDN